MPLYEGDLNALADHLEPGHPFVEDLVCAARVGLKGRSGRKYTAFTEAAGAGGDGIRCAAGALYDQIIAREPDIKFDRRKRRDKSSGAQLFRCIDEILRDDRASCLEMALLFASCALRAGLAPVLLVVEGEKLDHAIIGLWLDEHGEERNRLRTLGGTLPSDEIPGLIGADRFETASGYLDHVDDTEMLVVDCSGAAAGYLSPSGLRCIRFKSAVEEAWRQVGPTSIGIRCALDLKQASRKKCFLVSAPADFVGRGYDLGAVHAAVDRVGRVIVSGMIGVGKTTLAQRYADLHRQAYPDGVFQLNAGDEVSFVEKLAGFGRETGVGGGTPGKGKEGPSDNIAFASVWTNEMSKPACRALLIVDDVSKAWVVTEPISGLPRLSDLRCDLLVTTRNADLIHELDDFQAIPLPDLDPGDAVELLLNGLPEDQQDRRTAHDICRYLNYTPVWVRLVNAKLRKPKAPSLIEYLQTLTERGVVGDDATALATSLLQDTWDGLSNETGGPHDLLKLLSILPLNDIAPEELLALMIDAAGDDEEASTRVARVRDAIRALVAAGAAEMPEPASVRIHTTMHEFAKAKCGDQSGFVPGVLQLVVDRLHAKEFYRADDTLIRRIEQLLRSLRGLSIESPNLRAALEIFDSQLDNLRNRFDGLQQLALQAHLDGSEDLAAVVERVRGEQERPWFRLRWHRRHERAPRPGRRRPRRRGVGGRGLARSGRSAGGSARCFGRRER